jgi:P4 family phage/plasmid primase-like protien
MTTDEAGYARLPVAAQYYGTLGWKVLPVHGMTADGRCTCGLAHSDPKDIAKHPAIASWQTESTADEVTISSWWNRDSRFNVGVMCRESGFFVIDIDPRSGGFESYDKFFELMDGNVPQTVEAKTGEYIHKGRTVQGRHLYFKVSPHERLKGNLKAEGLPGIDIKHNGYTLLAPSNHVSGATYEWKPGHAPWEMDMTEAPEELLAALRVGKGGTRSKVSLGTTDWSWLEDLEWNGEKLDLDRLLEEGIDEGSRAVDLYAMACAMANKLGTDSIGRMSVETNMIRFNAEKVRPPLEVEGQGGLISHVRRALDFVESNPKTEKAGVMGGPAVEWARKSQAESQTRKAGVVTAPVFRPPVSMSTSDPDDAYYVDTTLPGTLGGQVSEALHSGDSIMRMNIDIPKDPDALREEDGGMPGMRSLTDVGNGRRLVDVFGHGIRYSAGLGFFNWSGVYWEPDTEDLKIQEISKRLAPIIAAEYNKYEGDMVEQAKVVKWADQSKSNARLKNARDSATSDPRIVVAVDDWDSKVEHFGVLNGVVDLRTGELMRGRPDLYITRRAPVAYTPGIRSQRWEDFLSFATGGDIDYAEWLQKAAGYTLTGLRTHDVMFLMYGPGGSGKNTFVEALVKAMGTQQYAWPMDSQILAQGDGQAHGSDLYHWAELRGRRMVWVDELPESERLKENSVKKLTGSSEISARSPGEKPFTFSSQAKLWVTTNHRPIITDDAMWRRIRPIPWNNVPANPDPGLKDYLFDPEGGQPAVLAWAVEGAMKILNSKDRDSLGWCKAVQDAADIYKANEDRIGMFLNEETTEAPGRDLPLKELFLVYQIWSGERGEKPMSQIAFQRKLSDRGLDVSGTGARAEIKNRAKVLHAASEFSWDSAMRSAR